MKVIVKDNQHYIDSTSLKKIIFIFLFLSLSKLDFSNKCLFYFLFEVIYTYWKGKWGEGVVFMAKLSLVQNEIVESCLGHLLYDGTTCFQHGGSLKVNHSWLETADYYKCLVSNAAD